MLMEFLNGCRVGQACLKDCLTVNLDIYYFNLTVVYLNKKKNKKNMENRKHKKISKNY